MSMSRLGGSPGRASKTSASKKSVEVTILGQRMHLRTDADPREIERMAAYVNGKLEEVSSQGPISTTKLAILAALNIAEDYFDAMGEHDAFRQEVARRSRALLAQLEE